MVNVKEGIGCATEINENDYMQYDCFFCCNYIATVTVDKTVTIIELAKVKSAKTFDETPDHMFSGAT